MTHTRARGKVNEALYDLTLNHYFPSVPLDNLFAAVESHGFEIPEDERPILVCGRQGRAVVPLTRMDPDAVAYARAADALGGQTRAPRAFNGALTFTWYQMESGRYEVVAYVTGGAS